MVPDNRKYAIVDYSSVTEDMIDEILQSSMSSCRRSTNGDDRAIVSWNGNKPRSLYGITAYTHTQMLSIVNDTSGDWYSDEQATPSQE